MLIVMSAITIGTDKDYTPSNHVLFYLKSWLIISSQEARD